jgi:hypothetical protein
VNVVNLVKENNVQIYGVCVFFPLKCIWFWGCSLYSRQPVTGPIQYSLYFEVEDY